MVGVDLRVVIWFVVLIVSFVAVFCVCGALCLLVSCLGLCCCGFLQLTECFV